MSAKRILLLHTGGTLGMQGEPLEPGLFNDELLERVPELREIASIETHFVCNLDSSDIGSPQWMLLSQAVADARGDFDGVVVVHGTDTMAYSAAALAFTLSNLDIPVVFTGAQRPLSAYRTDARRNLADAVELATRGICEVGICFDGLLMRGCRSVKADARSYRAFASPGLQPLARLGTDIEFASIIRRPSGTFSCHPVFCADIDVVFITPSLCPKRLARRLSDPSLKGVVVAAFGVGTVPTTTTSIAPVFAEAIARGVDVLVVTQWGGRVRLGAYKNSLGLFEAGAIPGGEMRIEAAVPKLMHALARYSNRYERREYLQADVAGEQG